MNENFDLDETLDIDLADSFVFDLKKISAQIQREAEERRTNRADPVNDETESTVYPVAKTSWTAQLLNCFRKDRA